MPQHPGSSHNPSGGGSGFTASPAAPSQGPLGGTLGIPQGGIVPSGPPTSEALSEIIQMIRGGQVGAERFLEVLELLASQTVPTMSPGPEQGPEGPGGPGGSQSITQLLG